MKSGFVACASLAAQALHGQTFGWIGGDTRYSSGAIVAGAAVIGLALGLLLPETEPERRQRWGNRARSCARVTAASSA